MHRKILNPRPGMETDHRDHNGLNNQKTNLRIVTAGQNQHNQKKHKGTTSQFKGVSWRKKMSKWQVQIMIHYNRIYLGMFTSEIQAAKAYDRAAIKYFGEFACTNFPRSDYL